MRILWLLGEWALTSLRDGGRMMIFLGTALCWIFLPPLKWRRMIARIHFIRAKSLLVVLPTGDPKNTRLNSPLPLHDALPLFFLGPALCWIFPPPLKWRRMIARIHFIGAKSLLVILLTGVFTGMVLGLQVFYTLTKFGSEAFLGPAVALTLIRELGPVLCALMVTGRAGSALTAEI